MSVNHSERKHALLSASGASRWINCTPSARMEEALNIREESSVFAEEGTLAHEFADLELRIQTFTGNNADKRKMIEQKEALKSHELYQPEMLDYVQLYVDYVLEEYIAAKLGGNTPILKVEEKTDFSYLVPEGFGTSDANIIAEGGLEIVDLKYGKGVKVDAVNNSQMRLYALGLLRKFDLEYSIETVKMTIIQPRLDHIDSETLTVDELHAWAEKVVKPSADLAHKGEGECKTGDWCRWCKAKPVCRTLAEVNTALAKKDFADPKTLSIDELTEVYKQSSLLVDWSNAVASHLLKVALDGEKVPGYKLVEGRSVRKWADEDKAIFKLTEKEGFTRDDVTNTKIKGIGDIEKLVGKSGFAKLDLTIKPQGKPTLVPESDKRPSIGESIKNDFD